MKTVFFNGEDTYYRNSRISFQGPNPYSYQKRNEVGGVKKMANFAEGSVLFMLTQQVGEWVRKSTKSGDVIQGWSQVDYFFHVFLLRLTTFCPREIVNPTPSLRKGQFYCRKYGAQNKKLVIFRWKNILIFII